MKKLKHLVAISPSYISDRRYGVEIEVEGVRLPTNLPSSVWRIETDSSLKTDEAYEYVTNGPMDLMGVKTALDILDAAYKHKKTEVFDSVRAGVHVHMNVQDWNIKELMTFSLCYYIVEDILLKWCGENREGNLFCLRTRDAEFVLFKVLETLKNRNLNILKNDIIRYSSLNYCSLFKYGTVEFRGMRGTGDLDAIYTWVKIIDELRETSQTFTDPVDVINSMSGDGEINFLHRLFPTHHELFNFPDMTKIIRNAARRVQMIAFGVDWDELSKPPVNIFSEAKGL